MSECQRNYGGMSWQGASVCGHQRHEGGTGQKLKNSGLIEVFDGVFISEEVGYEKPAMEFFDKVFRTIGEKDRFRVLIVGDSLTSDIRGGNNAGIQTCWYNPEKKENDAGVTIDYEIEDLIQVLELL